MKLNITLTLTEEMLGTKPANANVFADFVASKCEDDSKRKEELETAEHIEEAGTTVFHKVEGQPILWDYQIKGFLKDALGSLNRMDKDMRAGLEKLTAHKTKVDGCVFPLARVIPIQLPEGGRLGICERPLRAETAQGPRVSLCRSETVPAGSRIQFILAILSKDLLPYVKAAFKYGELRGLGQWRNSGKGRFEAEITEAR